MPRLSFARLLLLTFSGLLAGCGSLQKDLDVVLPSGPAQLVVEAYLEPNVIPRLTVTESVPYVSDPTPTVPTDVTVVLTLPGGGRDTLYYSPGVSGTTRKAYTHIGRRPLAARPGDTFQLDVTDTQGRHVTGSATMPATVPIDSVEWKFNDKTGEQRQAYLLCTFQDPATPADNYRFLVHERRTTRDAEIDYTLQDRLTNGESITVGTSYQFAPNDTLFVTLFHLDAPYFNFLQSVQDARNANANPFSQPAAIQSTVQGGLGVFTVLNYQRRRIVLTE